MSNITSLFKENKNNKWILFYIVLGVIQALWTNMSSFPPLPFRLLMIFAVFIPLVFKRELILFAIPFFMTLRGQLATDYQYLPDINTYIFYFGVLTIVFCIHGSSVNLKNYNYLLPLIIFCFYLFLIDIFFTQDIGPYVKHIFFGLFFALFIVKKTDIHILSAALIAVSILLAVYYILMYDQFLQVYNTAEGVERSGWNDPNYFAILLGTGFMIAVLYLLNYLQSDLFIFNKHILLVGTFVIFSAVVMTASRAGFFVVSATAIFALVKSKTKITTVLRFILIAFVFIFVLYKAGIFDTLIFRILDEGNIDTGGSRTIIWKRVCDNFSSQPIRFQLFGGGYWHRAFLSHGRETHNEFLAILSDYGILGIIIFLSILFSMFIGRGSSNKESKVSTIFYILAITTLSPFQHVYIVFFIIWVLSIKKFKHIDDIEITN